MKTEVATRQDWSRLNPGDHVTVAEYCRKPYRAIVDVLTADTAFIWVLPESGATRKVFDCREDVVIHPSEEADPLLTPAWHRAHPGQAP